MISFEHEGWNTYSLRVRIWRVYFNFRITYMPKPRILRRTV
jgi:hypothetical protein